MLQRYVRYTATLMRVLQTLMHVLHTFMHVLHTLMHVLQTLMHVLQTFMHASQTGCMAESLPPGELIDSLISSDLCSHQSVTHLTQLLV